MTVPSIAQLFVSHWKLIPSVEIEAAVVAGLYLWGTTRIRSRWPVRRTLSFLAGVAAVAIALQSGINSYDDVLLTAHMVQHLILLLVAPLLILWGHPMMVMLRAFPRSPRRALGAAMLRLRVIGDWSVGLAVVYVVILGTHVPAVFDAALRHPLVHELEHIAYLAGGLIFFWPVFGHPVGRRSLGSVGSICYLIASMPACAIVGAYLNRYSTVAYAPYAQADHALGISSVINQQDAGAIMWVGAHLLLTGVALWVFGAKLIAEERRQRVLDAIEARAPLGPATGEDGAALG